MKLNEVLFLRVGIDVKKIVIKDGMANQGDNSKESAYLQTFHFEEQRIPKT